ncbi:MAG: LON peptidase substrate-binding domain-containing protein [Candidatus Binataceae bacterium]
MQLTAAQRRLAHEYGYRNWAKMMTAVASMSLAGNGGANPSRPTGPPPISESGANVFPLLPLRGLVTFPHVSYPIFVGRQKSIRAVEHAIDRKVSIVLAAQRDARSENPSNSDMYQVGTFAKAIQLVRLPDGTIKIILEATARARVSRFVFDEDFSKAEALEIEEPAISDPGIESLVPSVIAALVRKRAKTFGEENPEGWAVAATTADGASMLADRIASELVVDLAWKQALLELLNPAERLEKLLVYLNALS